MARPKKQQVAKVSDLQNLQALVVKALAQEIEQGISTGELNQAAIRNALQVCRDNEVVAVDDTIDEIGRLERLLPVISLEDVQRTTHRYV